MSHPRLESNVLTFEFRKLYSDGIPKTSVIPEIGAYFIVEVTKPFQAGELEIFKTGKIKDRGGSNPLKDYVKIFDINPHEPVKVKVKRGKALRKPKSVGGFYFSFCQEEHFEFKETTDIDQEGCVQTFRLFFTVSIESTLGSIDPSKISTTFTADSGLGDAAEKVNDALEIGKNVQESTNDLQELLLKAEVFVKFVEKLSAVHPIAEAVVTSLTAVYKVYEFQRSRDKAVLELIQEMKEVYILVEKAVKSVENAGPEIILTLKDISRALFNCGELIRVYSKPSLWERLWENIKSDIGPETEGQKSILRMLRDRLVDLTGMDASEKAGTALNLIKTMYDQA